MTLTVIATKQKTTKKSLKPSESCVLWHFVSFHFSYRFISFLLAWLFVFCNGDNVKISINKIKIVLSLSFGLCSEFAKPFFFLFMKESNSYTGVSFWHSLVDCEYETLIFSLFSARYLFNINGLCVHLVCAFGLLFITIHIQYISTLNLWSLFLQLNCVRH